MFPLFPKKMGWKNINISFEWNPMTILQKIDRKLVDKFNAKEFLKGRLEMEYFDENLSSHDLNQHWHQNLVD